MNSLAKWLMLDRCTPTPIIRGIGVIHIIWGILLLAYGPIYCISLHTLLGLGTSTATIAVALLITGLLAQGTPFAKSTLVKTLLVLPQQFMLGLSAGGAIWAIIISQYADGTLRSRPFIGIDQSPILLLMALHAFAVGQLHME